MATVCGGETLGEGNRALWRCEAAAFVQLWALRDLGGRNPVGSSPPADTAWAGSRLTELLAEHSPAAGMRESWFPGGGWISTVGKTCLPCLTTKFPCLQSTDTLS